MSISSYDSATGQLTPVAGVPNVDQILSDTSRNPVANRAVSAALDTKVEKTVNDLVNYYTITQIDDIIDHIEIDVDDTISATSENPVQNKVIKAALDNKVDTVTGKGLSTNDYTNADAAAVAALGTASTKNSTNSVTAGSTDLVESGAVKTAIDNAITAVYKAGGSKTCAELTSALLVAANEGMVYNMSDAGTTTSDFIEGAGKGIDIGSDVAVIKVGNAYKFNLLSGMVDLSNYIQKSSTSGLVKNDGSIDTKSYVEQVSGKGLSTNDYTDADMTKLSGIESGAEVNTIETIKVNGTALTPDQDRAVDITIAGDADDITYDNTTSGLDATNVQNAVDELADEKVDKVTGKQLSTEDYTTAEKTKLAGIDIATASTNGLVHPDDDTIHVDNTGEIGIDEDFKRIFIGTKEEWGQLTTVEKVVYDEAHFTDDSDLNAITDEITDGDMRAVTSNAVYDALKDIIHPIGTIIHSTTCDTMAKVVEVYGGTTWIQHSGYGLRGATSGVVANSAAKTGGSDTVTLSAANMPYHRHSIPALSGTAASAGSHNHNAIDTKQAISASATGGGYAVPTANTATTLDLVTSSAGAHTHSVTTTASNTGYAGGSGGAATAFSIVENYKAVYIWERIA